ncbi:MAG: hypothetical protein OES09_14165, partial [Gammaproteobacteria bacterium]|nr:hypothetical protein [Gammaproteobacteria bacterium]
MEITDSMRIDKPSLRASLIARTAFIVAVSYSGNVSAVDVDAGLRVGATWSDNIGLQPTPSEIDDIAYSVSPQLTVVHASPALDANLRSQLYWSRYADAKATSSFGEGEASLTAKAWQQSLAVEIGALRYQVLSDPQQLITTSRLPLSGALTDRDEWYVNPRLNRSFANSLTVNAGYRYSENSFETAGAQEDTNHTGNFSLDNYNGGQGLTWALRYDWRRSEYELVTPWENQRAIAE